MSHPDQETIERFVMGTLDDDADFVAHVAECDDCSSKLQREAAIELAMHDVQARAATTPAVVEASVPPAPPVRASVARRRIGPALVFAAAAGLLAWVGHQRAVRRTEDEAASAVRVVSCPIGAKQLGCIANAHRTGAHLEYPSGTPLADLGREPGLSVLVEPKSSDGILADMDDLLVWAQEELKRCAEKVIVSQKAPVRVGEVGVNFAVGPTGRVQESQTHVLVLDSDAGTKARGRELEEAGSDFKIASCLATAVDRYPFHGESKVVRISLGAKYIWRE